MRKGLHIALNHTASAKLPRTLLVGLTAIMAVAIVGPFGTREVLGPASLVLFWAAIIGWNFVKWQFWASLVAPRFARTLRSRIAAYMAGGILINASLPLEIEWALAAMRLPARIAFLETYTVAFALTMLIGAVTLIGKTRSYPDTSVVEEPTGLQPAPVEESRLGPLFERGRIARTADLLAIEAEDHYVRLHLANGQRLLVLYRFGDALADLAGLDGEQVHRGAWVSAGAVAGAEREGRKWRLKLINGTVIPLSDSFASVARRRGWLHAGEPIGEA